MKIKKATKSLFGGVRKAIPPALSSSRKPAWMITDPAKQREALETQRMTSSQNRPPEVFFADGETKRFRFRDARHIALLNRYSLNMGGNTWRQFTAPGEESVDLFAENGFRSQLRAVYEVIDRTGYEDKTGKRHKNIARFFVVNSMLLEQLELIRKRSGGDLSKFDIEITRNGSSRMTQYICMPRPMSEAPPEFQRIPRLSTDFTKYYGPLNESQQRAVLSKVGRAGTED